jgi:hypothetical protein
MPLPHPLTITRSREQIAQDFMIVGIDRCPDPHWHFKIAVHRESRLGPQGDIAPSPDRPLQTLALLNRREPLYDIEVFGFHLPRELHPADWLDLWLESQQIAVQSRKAIPMSPASGVCGDCVGTWDVPGEGKFAGRFVALKWDYRLYLLALRTPEALYPEIAEDFFLAMANFQPADTTHRIPLAQEALRISATAPFAWQTILPDSWVVAPDVHDARLSSFQAKCLPLAGGPDRTPFGHLTFAMADHSLAEDANAAAQKFLGALADNGATFDRIHMIPQPTPDGFKAHWLMTTLGHLKIQPDNRQIEAEFACRILEHENAWFTAGLTTPRRPSAPISWMHNKRSLDLLITSLELP